MHSFCSNCQFSYSTILSSFRPNVPIWNLHCLILCATLLSQLIKYLLWMLWVTLAYHKEVFSCFNTLSSLRNPLSKAWTTSKAGGLSRLIKYFLCIQISLVDNYFHFTLCFLGRTLKTTNLLNALHIMLQFLIKSVP